VVFEAILNKAPVSPTRLNPEVSPELERAIFKALEKDRDMRYQSAADLLADLKRVRRETESGRSAAVAAVPAPARKSRVWLYAAAALLAVILVSGPLLFRSRGKPAPAGGAWQQLTNFSDAVFDPALSPDGRMLAFVRGSALLGGTGQVYVKMLPDGQPVQLTHDQKGKRQPVFSPDGSRIAYTTTPGFDTSVVPVLAGQPQPMLPNASGLTWIDKDHILFSEVKTWPHMAIVTA